MKHKFAHEPLFDVQKGHVKVYCTGRGCGVQSGKLDSMEDAMDADQGHLALVGIVEKQKMK